jgi:Fe-S-cluster containining protein
MPGILCEHCTAACCRYIALPIETPTERSDFDDIRWYLLHENISVFVEDGDWYISMLTNCRHVQPDGRCAIYARRPGICRKYTTENCDYHSGDYGWEAHFTCPEHLDEYVRARFDKRCNGDDAGRSSKRSKKLQSSQSSKRNNCSQNSHRLQRQSSDYSEYSYKRTTKSGKRTAGASRAGAPAFCDLHGRPLPALEGPR